MILIKENVERIIDDDSQGIIDQLLLNGWSKAPDPKPKKKRKSGSEVDADAQTV
jgi:hypothetical protein